MLTRENFSYLYELCELLRVSAFWLGSNKQQMFG